MKDETIEIIYEDEAVIVCRKPAGRATQTAKLGQQDMVTLLKNYRAGKKETPYIGVVHRLDQPVEGLMVFAKTKEAAAKLCAQMAKHRIGKHYYAAAYAPEGKNIRLRQQGTLTDYLSFDAQKNRTKILPLEERQKGKKAVLDYRVLEFRENLLFLDITLRTGRHHQIRAQLANQGCPIVGDKKYGFGGNGEETPRPLALCAYRLEFAHPADGRMMEFSIEPTWRKDYRFL